MENRKEQIILRIPAEERALLVVRMTAAGVLAGKGLDVESLEDLKTAVYEACYALMHQRMRTDSLEICFLAQDGFAVQVRCVGEWRESAERLPDVKLCRAVLETIVPCVEIQMEQGAMTAIRMWSDEGASCAFGG